MTTELITGHAGSAHVSAADVGWFNVGVVGEGKYVLDTGTQFACNVQSANLVTIGIGDALFEGRHVRVSATENVSLDNGAQGMNRNDLICIKYEYASSTSVESASIAVIKGTASSGTATDPDVPSGSILEGASTAYMPLWRIPISSITVGTPEKLYGEVLTALGGALNRTWDVTQIPNLPASKTTSGTFDVARIPTLTADKIPNLSASKITSDTIPIARGGTGASTAANALRNIMAGKTVLYNNTSGSNGTITLSASAANYNHMRIYYKNTDDAANSVSSVDVYSPNGKIVNLACVDGYATGNTWFQVRLVKINGTSIATYNNNYTQAYIDSDGGADSMHNNYVSILRVEGWNE